MKIRTWQGDLSSIHVYLGLLGNLPHGCPIYTESLNPSSYWNNRHVENHEVASLSHTRFACFGREYGLAYWRCLEKTVECLLDLKQTLGTRENVHQPKRFRLQLLPVITAAG